MRAKPLLSCIFWLAAASLFAQDFVCRQYDIGQGLPSSELYDVLQDKQGFIWIASDRGVSRFDGYTFTNFTAEDGLTDNTVFNLCEDQLGRIWFNTFNARLCYYANGKFTEYRFNDSILKYTGSSRLLRTFYIQADGSLLLGYYYSGILHISPAGKVTRIQPVPNPIYGQQALIGKDAFAAGEQIRFPPGPDFYFQYEKDGRDHRVQLDDLLPGQQKIFTLALQRRNGTACFALRQQLVEVAVDGSCRVHRFDSEIMRICEDRDSCLWISFRKGGVSQYAPNAGPGETPLGTYFSGQFVSCVYKDAEGGYWFATLKNGLLHVSSICFNLLFSEDDINSPGVGSITGDGHGLVFIGMKNGLIHRRRNGVWETFDARNSPEPNAELASVIYDTTRKQLWIGFNRGSDGIMFMEENGTMRQWTRYHARSLLLKGDSLFAGTANGLICGNRDEKKTSWIGKIIRIESIFADRGGTTWLGTRLGLMRVSGDQIVYADSTHPLLRKKAICIAQLADGRLALGTVGSGLVLFDPLSGAADSITKADGLINNIVNAMAPAPDGSLWIATPAGLSCLQFGPGGKCVIRNYTDENGLPTNEIRSVYVSGNEVWLGTRKGVVHFFPGELAPSAYRAPVYLYSVRVGDSLVDPGRTAVFHYDQDRLSFSFIGLSFRRHGKVTYRYLLEGLSGDTLTTASPQASFLSIPPGEYRFLVWAENEDGVLSAVPAVYSFVILPPFWQTWWFIGLSLAVIVLLATTILAAAFRRVKKQNRLRENLLEYQQQALANQMNPHFIFNSLNIVQSYIMREDKVSATKFLSRFSRLMRTSLDHSRMKLVPLNQELNLVRVYLELEAMRFGTRLDWSIEAPPELDSGKYQVPSMLIQPYIENAIRHGILNLAGQPGRVEVRLYKKGTTLFCEVEDNGVGRAAAEGKQDKTTHRSAGASITSGRLRLISKSLGHPYSIEFRDLFDAENKPAGTIVIFVLPYKLSDEENESARSGR